MPRKKHTVEEIIGGLWKMEVELGRGRTVVKGGHQRVLYQRVLYLLGAIFTSNLSGRLKRLPRPAPQTNWTREPVAQTECGL